jgi:hypothetical protein
MSADTKVTVTVSRFWAPVIRDAVLKVKELLKEADANASASNREVGY